ncbi:MAG TPA: GNAT family N-acetyltransferase [Ktedonobacteraceae bacterium]|nr:GNAT family N-acetyltransferase [Ktedonobacteraceae bacterium]
MRIRNYHEGDLLSLIEIQNRAAEADSTEVMTTSELGEWLSHPEVGADSNVFVLTDDDDEENQWGQAGTLEGLEGEIAGYTVLQARTSATGYHYWCEGAVHPNHRRKNAGRALLICALNRARILATEIEFEAEEAGLPIYFEALLPLYNPASEALAARCGMQATSEQTLKGMQLYRLEL